MSSVRCQKARASNLEEDLRTRRLRKARRTETLRRLEHNRAHHQIQPDAPRRHIRGIILAQEQSPHVTGAPETISVHILQAQNLQTDQFVEHEH